MSNTILTNIKGGILTITLARPEALNALNLALLKELKETIIDSYTNEEISAIIITGDGEKAFAAGADIKELSELHQLSALKVSEEGQALFALIENHAKPVIAAVNGFALGGGCELAMACHMRVATKNASFGQPEAKLGLLPGYGGTQRLSHLIGKARAMEHCMTCDLITATDAERLGLVNYITEDRETMMNKVHELLEKILSRSPHSVQSIIRSVNAGYEDGKDGYAVERESFAASFATLDFKEGVTAFMEKRKPKFIGK